MSVNLQALLTRTSFTVNWSLIIIIIIIIIYIAPLPIKELLRGAAGNDEFMCNIY